MKKYFRILIPGITLTLTGCASIVSGTHENLSVTTTPVEKATCVLSNDKGQWYIKSTPGSVKVHKSRKDLDVTCSKEGYKSNSLRVSSNIKAMVAGNILVGGLIGAGVDTVDGAAFAYQHTIQVPLRRKVN